MRAPAVPVPALAPAAGAEIRAVDVVDLPDADLIRRQAAWLAPARQWLLQQVDAARRRSVLDLGCGHGAVTQELRDLTAGRVFAVDHNPHPFCSGADAFRNVCPSCANAGRLPFAPSSFDLVFCQLALMWMPLQATLAEIRRVLEPEGALVALEPDYSGLMEYPPFIATRDLWVAALERAGADPFVGRKLPGALTRLGFRVRIDLMSELSPPAPERFDLLRGLPLTPKERQRLAAIERLARALSRPWDQVVHLPFFLISAVLP